MRVTVIVPRSRERGRLELPVALGELVPREPGHLQLRPGAKVVRAGQELADLGLVWGVVAGAPALEDPWVLVQADPVVADPGEQRLPAVGATNAEGGRRHPARGPDGRVALEGAGLP